METSFTDSDGVLWNVREDGADDSRSYATSDVQPGTTWLRFESDLEVRRLWHYPDDWRGLSPMQLESLLDRASTVVARFRSAQHRVPNVGDSLGSAEKSAERRATSSGVDVPPADPRSLNGNESA